MTLPIRGSAAVLSKIENHGRYTTGKRRLRTLGRATAAGGRGHEMSVHAWLARVDEMPADAHHIATTARTGIVLI
jgi:hypothetical protein